MNVWLNQYLRDVVVGFVSEINLSVRPFTFFKAWTQLTKVEYYVHIALDR